MPVYHLSVPTPQLHRRLMTLLLSTRFEVLYTLLVVLKHLGLISLVGSEISNRARLEGSQTHALLLLTACWESLRASAGAQRSACLPPEVSTRYLELGRSRHRLLIGCATRCAHACTAGFSAVSAHLAQPEGPTPS
jgi:hypothetical protein